MATEATIRGRLAIDTEEYEQKLRRLEEDYTRQKQLLLSEREQALMEAYKDYRMAGRSLPDLVSAEGRQGGLSESDGIRILTEYLEARRKAESLFGDKLSDAEYEAEAKREDYRGKLKSLKDKAELEIAAIKAKEAEKAAKAAAKNAAYAYDQKAARLRGGSRKKPHQESIYGVSAAWVPTKKSLDR